MYKSYNDKMENILPLIESESVDVILTDPPYLYLKNQKLDKQFDEELLFNEAKRILKRNGFIVLFGRGTSFYRWNTMLADLGFTFKEEIVWNKSHNTSPLMALSRVHETVSIFTKGKGTINKVKVPYLEMKRHDIDSIIQDIKRVRTILKNTKSLDAVLSFLENNSRDKSDEWNANNLSISSNITKEDRQVSVVRSIKNGMNEKSIIRTDRTDCDTFTKFEVNADKRQTGDRCTNAMQSVCFGLKEKSIINTYDYNSTDRAHNYKHNVVASPKLKNGDRCVYVVSNIIDGQNEKSIIKQVRDHYSTIHPTQKPVRLLERLLALVLPKDVEQPTVLDPFAGSFSTGVAAINVGCYPILIELDKEYYESGLARIKKDTQQLQLF